jgi:hypothetical protein
MIGGLRNPMFAIPPVIILLALLSACKSSASSSEIANRSLNQNDSATLSQSFPAQTTSVPKVREDEIPSFDESQMVPHKKRYSNYEYAYRVELPRELIGFTDPAPMPQHGIGVVLSKEPKSYIWVDGSYNAAFLESLDAAINQHLKWLAEDGTDIEVLRREKTRLQTLPAMRLVARYKSLATGEIRVQDLVVAFRQYDDDERGITYIVGLIAPESRYNEDVAVLEKIVSEWRMKPLPSA